MVRLHLVYLSIALIGTFVHHVFDSNVGRETQSAVAKIHGIAKGHHAAHNGPSHPFVSLGRALQRFAHGDNFAGGLATSDGPGVRGAHHNSLKHGLSADQGFFAAFQSGQKLDGDEESQVVF